MSKELDKDAFIALEEKELLWEIYSRCNSWNAYLRESNAFKDEYRTKGTFRYNSPHSTITVLEHPPVTKTCHCGNKGPWPHLMHNYDPVANFHSDIMITMYNKLVKLEKKPSSSFPENYAKKEDLDIIKKMIKALWKSLNEYDMPVDGYGSI